MKTRTIRHAAPELKQQQAEYAAAQNNLPVANRSYHVITYGCQLNDHDSEVIGGVLDAMGWIQAASAEEAGLVVFNTCSVRGNADQHFYGNLGLAKNWREQQPGMLVAVCGCMMKIEEHVDKIKRSYPWVDLIFGPSDIYRLPELLYRRLAGSRRVYDVGSEDLIVEDLPVVRERRSRALVTISYGCNNFCTYCIVPYTRGRERSRDPEAILAEVRQLKQEGFGEVMLLGQNVNSYGKDLSADRDFADLLAACAETGIPRIRFMTSHPKDISLKLLETMAAYPNIERHLHLPLQSGSDRILQLMNRRYSREQYLAMVRAARELMPELAFSTDIIVGYPGETEEDFAATLEVVAEVAFDSAFTFQYSPRYGTPAASLEAVPQEVVTERFNRLVELQNDNSLRANQVRVGRTYTVLIEGCSDHREEMLTGRASDNHLINFNLPAELLAAHGWQDLSDVELGAVLEGRFATVKVNAARTFSLEGEAVSILSSGNGA